MRLSVESSLVADSWALKKLGEYKGGKILLWSWLSRGLVTKEQIASWRYDGDISKVDELLASTPTELRQLCELDELPTPDQSKEEAEVTLAQSTTLKGEVVSAWGMKDPEIPDAQPIMFPTWFNASIDKTVLLWKQEASVWKKRWDKRINEGHDGFAPKMKQNYEQWAQDTTRQIVLNKVTKTQVTRLADKSARQLKKTCLMLVIHMSEKADNLGITAGAGKLWRLCLIKGKLPANDAVPAEIDHFEGENKF